MNHKTLITSALPYANGPIHLGHMVEHVLTDTYVRFLRSCGDDVVALCADDTHGTPIELRAASEGVTPEAFVQRFYTEHQKDFVDFDVIYDTYGSTHSEENQKYAELIYTRLKERGDIDRRDVEQAFCEKDQRFLPDRFIRGTCPNCQSPDQYGDVCEKCSKVYASTDLINPRCALCGTPPIRKKSPHLFFKLSKHADFLKQLIRDPQFIQTAVANQLQQFFEKGLADWDISRDGPYFGFPIPGEQNKYFYVWLDAPVGYVSTTEVWAKKTGKANSALDYWDKSSNARIIHVIGKDIVYFHALFWPAMLNFSDFKVPSRVHVHGHLTVNGEKMSKTRGTFINARDYLNILDPSYLRYFFAANLGPVSEDLDLSLKEFRLRVNADLVNNIGNLANRTLTLLSGPTGEKTSPRFDGPGRALVTDAIKRVADVRRAFEAFDFRQGIKAIVEIAQSANQFLTAQEPWKKIKTEPEIARRDLSDAADVVYLLAALLKPVVPRIADKLFKQLNAPDLTFKHLVEAQYPLLPREHRIETPEVLIARLEETQVQGLIATQGGLTPEKVAKASASVNVKSEVKAEAPASAEIEYPDFAKVELKVGKVLSAERVPKADKLLKLTVDVGEGTPRTIAAGIAEAYAPETLVGRNVVVVANLKAKALRGIESRGMLLAAGPGGKELSLVDPGQFAPGTEVK